MACLGVEPGVAGWKAQTNPLSYGMSNKNFDGSRRCHLFVLYDVKSLFTSFSFLTQKYNF